MLIRSCLSFYDLALSQSPSKHHFSASQPCDLSGPPGCFLKCFSLFLFLNNHYQVAGGYPPFWALSLNQSGEPAVRRQTG